MAPQNPYAQTLALLGVTGNTGQVVLRTLLEKNEHNLKIYARSLEKLMQMFPSLTSNPKIQLYIGSINDEDMVRGLLERCQTIICTLGNNGFAPTTILRESARSIIATLKSLRRNDAAWQRPRLIWLSSSSKNERFAAARPPIMHWLITTAFQFGYQDLQIAEDTIMADPALVSVLLVQPGVLVDEEATGYEISVDSVRLASSFADLGGAFVELASNSTYGSLTQVGVSSQQGDRPVRYAPIIVFRIFRGLFTYYVPCGVWIDQTLGSALTWLTISGSN